MSDRKYRFTEDDLVQCLPEGSLIEIGTALTPCMMHNWIDLATRLGLSNDEIEHIRTLNNYGYETLRMWKTREKATIRVLVNALTYMHRCDVIELVNKARTDPTDVTLVIRWEKDLVPVAEPKLNAIEGLTTVLEIARPHIQKMLSTNVRRKISACLCLPPGSSRTWTSPVNLFKGQQIEVELFHHKQHNKRAMTDCSPSPTKQYCIDEKGCLSYIENEVLFFDYVTDNNSNNNSKDNKLHPQRSSSLTRSENVTGDVFEFSRDQLCRTPSCDRTESLPGFHPEIPTDNTRRNKADEILQGHMEQNGAYIIRRSLEENSPYALSVVFKKTVLHFSIMKSDQTNGRTRFFVFADDGNKCEFDSVRELIDHYKKHSLSSPTMEIQTKELYLTRPVR